MSKETFRGYHRWTTKLNFFIHRVQSKVNRMHRYTTGALFAQFCILSAFCIHIIASSPFIICKFIRPYIEANMKIEKEKNVTKIIVLFKYFFLEGSCNQNTKV